MIEPQKDTDVEALVAAIIHSSTLRFKNNEINKKASTQFGYQYYYSLEEAVEETVIDYSKNIGAGELVQDISSTTSLKPTDTIIQTIFEGKKYESWDEIFIDIARAIIVEEIKIQHPNVVIENHRRSLLTEENWGKAHPSER